MSTTNQDLLYIRSAVGSLKDYLLSQELYWPLDVPLGVKNSILPDRLSLGGLLIARARLQALLLNSDQQEEFSKLDQEIQAIRDRWKSHWRNKADSELSSRLNLWKNFLDDYANDPYGHADDYPLEVRWRVMAQLLEEESEGVNPAGSSRLRQLDERLRQGFIPGGFAWDEDLIAGFPESRFWFLHGHLRKG